MGNVFVRWPLYRIKEKQVGEHGGWKKICSTATNSSNVPTQPLLGSHRGLTAVDVLDATSMLDSNNKRDMMRHTAA